MSDPEAVEGTPDVQDGGKASNIKNGHPKIFHLIIVLSFRRKRICNDASLLVSCSHFRPQLLLAMEAFHEVELKCVLYWDGL